MKTRVDAKKRLWGSVAVAFGTARTVPNVLDTPCVKEIRSTVPFSQLLADTLITFTWPAGFVNLSGSVIVCGEIMRLNDVTSSVLRHTSQFLLNLQQDTTAVTAIESVHRLIEAS